LDEDALRAELGEVSADLEAARIQYASIGARIAGLEAQRQALTKALQREFRPTDTTQAAVPRYRTDAIVAVLEASGTEMSIQDVMSALAEAGRPGETADNVGVDLAYLAGRGRVNRVRRGVYASASAPDASTAGPDGAQPASGGRPMRRDR
jgi:hypothetical protein